LETNINIISESENEIIISLTPEEIQSDLEMEIEKQTKNIQIDGFRKGKTPQNIIKKIYGDAIEIQAAEKLANKKFWEIIDGKNIKTLGEPVITDFNYKPGETFTYKVKYEIIPAIQLKDYTNQIIEIPEYKFNEEEINEEIERILQANAEKEEADIVLDNSYSLLVDVYKIDENQNENLVQENVNIDLFNKNVNKEIIENTKNKKINESFTFSVEEHYHNADDEHSEGHIHPKENYKAIIKKIDKMVFPELNEEFIKKITRDKFSNETELREDIKKDLLIYYDNMEQELIEIKLENSILKNNIFTVPKTYVNNYLDYLYEQEIKNAKKEGKQIISKEQFKQSMEKRAEATVKWSLIKEKIIELENISLTDEKLQEIAKKDAEKMNLPEENLLNIYKSDEYKDRLLNKTFYDFLKNNNIIKKISLEEYNQKEENKNEKQ